MTKKSYGKREKKTKEEGERRQRGEGRDKKERRERGDREIGARKKRSGKGGGRRGGSGEKEMTSESGTDTTIEIRYLVPQVHLFPSHIITLSTTTTTTKV